MPAEFIDLLNLPELDIGHSKKVLFTSDHFHTWVHGDYPGTKGPMHKHTADQQFYCVKGECTFHFPDSSSRKLTPGMLVTIPAGQLYQLDNTGDEYMILLGARAEAAAKPRFSGDEQVVTVRVTKSRQDQSSRRKESQSKSEFLNRSTTSHPSV